MRRAEDLDITMRAIDTLLRTADVKLVVVDDGSPYGVGELVSLSTNFELIAKRKNEGFATTVNHGLRRAVDRGLDALLVNADMEFRDNGWFKALTANQADVVGGLLMYSNRLVQHAGIYFSLISRRFDHIYRLAPSTLAEVKKPRDCPVTGALQLIRHGTLERVGLYDEHFVNGYEDVDYCQMVFQAGLRCAYEPKAKAIHHESMFRSQGTGDALRQRDLENIMYLGEKHQGWEFADYIPTLLWDSE